MKATYAIAALSVLSLSSLAAPSRPFLQLQADGSHALSLDSVLEKAESIPSLALDSWHAVQEKFAESLERLVETAASAADIAGPAAAAIAADDAVRPRHHKVLDFSDYTILEILNASLHAERPKKDGKRHSLFPFPHPPTEPAQLPLHKLAWIVNKSAEAIEALDKDGITLLAPDDWALTPPHRRSGHHGRRHVDDHETRRADRKRDCHGSATRRGKDDKEERRVHLLGRPVKIEREDALHSSDDRQANDRHGEFVRDMATATAEELENQPIAHAFHSSLFQAPCRHHDAESLAEDDDEDKKAKIAKIIAYILKYHILPEFACPWKLANSQTVASSLSADDEPLRIKVESTWALLPVPHPSIKFNYYARKRGLTVKAKNGIIHLISAPLLPPFSPLNGLFLFPQAFSTLTSGIQKVDLDDALLPSLSADSVDEDYDITDDVEKMMHELVKEKGDVFTVFAPTNFAFNRLGPKILAFLHSPLPISKKVLKYVLAYHIVPDIAFFSDYIQNTTSLDAYKVWEEVDVDFPAYLQQGSEGTIAGANADIFKMLAAADDHPGDNHAVDHWKPSLPDLLKPRMPGSPNAHPPKKVNVTHYELPTLLSKTGVNENATLHVGVVSYRKLGHGPVVKDIVVFPAKPPHHHHDDAEKADDDEARVMHHERKKVHPVKIWKTDAVARGGAIQAVNTVLRPPMPHHEHEKGVKENKKKVMLQKAFAELFG